MQRDLIGYGKNVPQIEWPGGARIAVSLVVNYEEGASEPSYGPSLLVMFDPAGEQNRIAH